MKKVFFFKNNKYLAWIFFLLAFIIRAIVALVGYSNQYYLQLADDKAYYELSQNVIEQGIFIPNINNFELFATGVIGPGIGWIGAIIFSLFGESWLPIFLVSALISSFITFFIYKLGLVLFDRRTAFYAASWSIIYVAFIKYVPGFGKDLWMTLLLLIIIYLYFTTIKEKGISIYDILLGFVFSFSIHIDERFLIFAPVIFFPLVKNKNLNFKSGITKAAVVMGVTLFLSIPWLIRNYDVYDRVILISTRTNIFTERIFGYEEKQYFNDYSKWYYLTESQIDSIINNEVQPHTDGKLYMHNKITPKNIRGGRMPTIVVPQQVDALKEGYIPHWFSFGETKLMNFINFWQPVDLCYGYYGNGYRFDGKWSLEHNFSIGLTYGILLPFFITGIFFSIKRKPKVALILLSYILIYMFVHVLFIDFTTQRYRLVLDPLIILLSMYSISVIYDKIKINIHNKNFYVK